MTVFQTDFRTFQTNFEAGKTQLIYRWIAGDLETPVSAYLKLCGHEPYAFLLESVEGGNVLGRYSIIGFDPDLIWRCENNSVTISGTHSGSSNDPMASLRETLKSCEIDHVPDGLPPMAASGLFGYIGYDMVRLVEDIPNTNPDDLGIPDSILIRPTVLAIFDNVKNMICIVCPIYKMTNKKAQNVFDNSMRILDEIEQKLLGPIPASTITNISQLSVPLSVSSNMQKDEYKAAVSKAVEYIHQGEIFQVVPGQRASGDFDLPALELYRHLRRVNPSPFLFHLAFEDFALVGSSPEILVRVRDNEVTIRPIAGTRKRGETAEKDQALAEDLLADPKERAEHLMLLDLGRNDVGRVSEIGSVKVTAQYFVEYYSHVMHIVSNVVGKLRNDFDIIDALFAGFPAGTVSGAPKVRAMEIIDELEVSRRGYYAGAVGYFSGHQELDTCIALRTALVKEGKVFVQAGGGVVADSDPELEYQETVNKAHAIIKAAELAISEHNKHEC